MGCRQRSGACGFNTCRPQRGGIFARLRTVQPDHQLSFLTRQAAVGDQACCIRAVLGQARRDVVAPMCTHRAERRCTGAGLLSLAECFEPRVHHRDGFMQGANLGKGAFQLLQQLRVAAGVGIAPTDERQREHAEGAEQQQRARRHDHDVERRKCQGLEHGWLLATVGV